MASSTPPPSHRKQEICESLTRLQQASTELLEVAQRFRSVMEDHQKKQNQGIPLTHIEEEEASRIGDEAISKRHITQESAAVEDTRIIAYDLLNCTRSCKTVAITNYRGLARSGYLCSKKTTKNLQRQRPVFFL